MFWRGLVTVLFLLTFSAQGSFAECDDALASLNDALARAKFGFTIESSLNNSPRVSGQPLHITTQYQLPFVWITNTHQGTDYSVVLKSHSGFGFGTAPTSSFQFIESKDLYLRSLDVGGLQSRILASLVHTDQTSGEKTLLLKAAGFADLQTGRIQALPGAPLAIGGIKDLDQEFVVSPRPNTPEFWITDSSRTVRIIGMDDEGNLEARSFEIEENVRIGRRQFQIEKVLKIQFFKDTAEAYIKFQTTDGSVRMAKMRVFEEPETLSAEELQSKAGSETAVEELGVITSYEIDFQNSVKLKEGSNRSTSHPNEPLIYVTYANRLDVYSAESDLELLASVKLPKEISDLELRGVEFYWLGEFREIQEENGSKGRIFIGEVKAALLLWDAKVQATRIVWAKIGAQ